MNSLLTALSLALIYTFPGSAFGETLDLMKCRQALVKLDGSKAEGQERLDKKWKTLAGCEKDLSQQLLAYGPLRDGLLASIKACRNEKDGSVVAQQDSAECMLSLYKMYSKEGFLDKTVDEYIKAGYVCTQPPKKKEDPCPANDCGRISPPEAKH